MPRRAPEVAGDLPHAPCRATTLCANRTHGPDCEIVDLLLGELRCVRPHPFTVAACCERLAGPQEGCGADRRFRLGHRRPLGDPKPQESPPTGEHAFRVAATTTNLGWGPGAIVINSTDYRHAWATNDPSALEVHLAPGADPLTTRRAIQRALGPNIALQAQTTHERELHANALARAGLARLSQISTLLLIAAALAMAAAMSTAIWQRRPALAQLQIQGCRPPQTLARPAPRNRPRPPRRLPHRRHRRPLRPLPPRPLAPTNHRLPRPLHPHHHPNRHHLPPRRRSRPPRHRNPRLHRLQSPHPPRTQHRHLTTANRSAKPVYFQTQINGVRRPARLHGATLLHPNESLRFLYGLDARQGQAPRHGRRDRPAGVGGVAAGSSRARAVRAGGMRSWLSWTRSARASSAGSPSTDGEAGDCRAHAARTASSPNARANSYRSPRRTDRRRAPWLRSTTALDA